MKRSPVKRSVANPVRPSLDGVRVMKFSVNLHHEIGNRLKEAAFQLRLSESSIVEVALKELFSRISPDLLEAFLRQNGASLRRKTTP